MHVQSPQLLLEHSLEMKNDKIIFKKNEYIKQFWLFFLVTTAHAPVVTIAIEFVFQK